MRAVNRRKGIAERNGSVVSGSIAMLASLGLAAHCSPSQGLRVRLLFPILTGFEYEQIARMAPQATIVELGGQSFVEVASFEDARVAHQLGLSIQKQIPIPFDLAFDPSHPQLGIALGGDAPRSSNPIARALAPMPIQPTTPIQPATPSLASLLAPSRAPAFPAQLRPQAQASRSLPSHQRRPNGGATALGPLSLTTILKQGKTAPATSPASAVPASSAVPAASPAAATLAAPPGSAAPAPVAAAATAQAAPPPTAPVPAARPQPAQLPSAQPQWSASPVAPAPSIVTAEPWQQPQEWGGHDPLTGMALSSSPEGRPALESAGVVAPAPATEALAPASAAEQRSALPESHAESVAITPTPLPPAPEALSGVTLPLPSAPAQPAPSAAAPPAIARTALARRASAPTPEASKATAAAAQPPATAKPDGAARPSPDPAAEAPAASSLLQARAQATEPAAPRPEPMAPPTSSAPNPSEVAGPAPGASADSAAALAAASEATSWPSELAELAAPAGEDNFEVILRDLLAPMPLRAAALLPNAQAKLSPQTPASSSERWLGAVPSEAVALGLPFTRFEPSINGEIDYLYVRVEQASDLERLQRILPVEELNVNGGMVLARVGVFTRSSQGRALRDSRIATLRQARIEPLLAKGGRLLPLA